MAGGRSTPGVTNFIGSFDNERTRPRPLSEHEVNALLFEKAADTTKERTAAVIEFSAGDNVKVIDGPFSNFSGRD